MYTTPWVRRLLFANILIFFAQLTVPGLTDWLIFVPDPMYVLTHPWTIITYMFIHAPGFAHIGFNMLTLWFFGPRVEDRLGGKHFIQLYLVSGITGAILSFLLAPQSSILGASGAIYGVMLAFAMFWPRVQILIWGVIPLEARWLILITTAISVYSGIGGSRGGMADYAHLGGYLGAFIYLRIIDPKRVVRKFRERAVAKKADDELANWKRVDANKVHEVNRDELNRILDKINTHGLESLTAQERLFLSNFVPPDDRPKVS